MPPVEHSISWHDTIRMKRSVCHPIHGAARSVVVMLHVWYAIAFRFNSHFGDFAFFFLTFFKTFLTFPLGVRFRVQLAFALQLAFGFRVNIWVRVEDEGLALGASVSFEVSILCLLRFCQSCCHRHLGGKIDIAKILNLVLCFIIKNLMYSMPYLFFKNFKNQDL